jgi:hypothetical protein
MAPLSATATRCLLGPLLALLVSLPGAALAQDDAGQEEVGLLLGARGVGEVWQDSLLIRELGRSSRFGGTGFLSYRIWRFVGFDIEVGYHRMKGSGAERNTDATLAESTTWEMVPVAMSASAAHAVGAVEVFGSLGTAMTVYSSTDEKGTISGTKFGPAAMIGARIDTGLVQPTIRRDAPNRLRSVDLELAIGRRQHQPFGIGEGLDLSAWRVGVGLVARM